MSPSAAVARDKWLVVGSIGAICFVIAGSSAAVVGPVFVPMMREFGWSNGKTSALATSYTLAFLATTPAVGLLADRIGARAIMIFGTLAACSGLFVVSQCSSWMGMLLAFALVGLGINATFYLPSAMVVTSWMGSQRALGMGIVMGAMSAGATVFSTLIGWWFELYGWRTTVAGIAALILLMLPIIFFFVKGRPSGDNPVGVIEKITESPPSVRNNLSSQSVILTIISGALFGFGMQGVYFHVVPLLISSGYSAHMAGLAYGGTWLLSGLGSLALGVIAERAGTKATLAGALIMCAIGTLCLLGADVTTPGVACVVAFVLFWGASVNSFGQMAPVLFAELCGSRNLGGLIGIQLAAAGLVGAAAPVVSGWIYDKFGGYRLAIDTDAAAVFFAFVLILLIGTRKNRVANGILRHPKPDVVHLG
jgi:OFA family oxalate/formate antiporter-like MFS transporter